MEKSNIKIGLEVVITNTNGWFKVGTICTVVRAGTGSTLLKEVGGNKDTWWISYDKFRPTTLKSKLVDGQHVLLQDGDILSYNEDRATFDYTVGRFIGEMSMMLSSYDDDLKSRDGFSVIEIFTPEQVVTTTTEKVVHYTRPAVLKVTQADIDAKFGCKTEVIA